jgi:hypothetical protein
VNRLLIAGVLLAAISLTACGSNVSKEEAPPPEATQSNPELESADPGSVSKTEFGEEWPLKVPSGDLRCEGSEGFGSVVFTAPNGTDYAVNGPALDNGYPEIEPIWRFEPGLEKYELRVNMSPLLERGLALCE